METSTDPKGHFTEGEALSKIGKRVRATARMGTVPKWASGKVCDARCYNDVWYVAIDWNPWWTLSARSTLLFDKIKYQKFVKEHE